MRDAQEAGGPRGADTEPVKEAPHSDGAAAEPDGHAQAVEHPARAPHRLDPRPAPEAEEHPSQGAVTDAPLPKEQAATAAPREPAEKPAEPTPQHRSGTKDPPPAREVRELDSQSAKAVAGSANPADEPEPVKEGMQRPADPEDADDVMTRRLPGSEAEDAAVLAQSRRRTRRSFLGALGGAAAGYGVYAFLQYGPTRGMQPSPIRNALNFNAYLNRELFRYRPLAPTYPLARAENLRINGIFGLKKELMLDTWRLQVVGVRGAARHPQYASDVTAWSYRYQGENAGLSENHDTKEAPKPAGAAPAPPEGQSQEGGDGQQGKSMPAIASSTKMSPKPMLAKAMADEMPNDDDQGGGEDDNHLGRKPRGQEESGESDSTLRAGTPGLLLTLEDITRLPRHELVTQFKCIEGWSQIVHWAGVRAADFLEAYPPELIDGREPEYVYMETPNGDYYTGYRLRELRHPQALLVTEMMGAPLTQLHGAPLRLHMPNKYGYKQIKRIGLIAYTNDKPDDYWTKLGYDWYADL